MKFRKITGSDKFQLIHKQKDKLFNSPKQKKIN